jgi:hypothetical protein
MAISPGIRAVFGHFQNLNLLALLQDLHGERTARQAWSSGTQLCPVAHGLPAGRHVREVTILGQAVDLIHGCEYAARHLGADPLAVLRFVRSWDEEVLGRDWLVRQLEELWDERLEDAVALQTLLQGERSRDPEAALKAPGRIGWGYQSCHS